MTTEDAIQAAARALHETTRETWEPGWGDLSEATRKRLRKEARIILQAADPHQPQPQPGAVILNEDGTWTRIPEAEQPVSEYTQTTEKVRLRYVAMRNQATGDPIPEIEAEFDRWLAAHDEQTRADERRRVLRALSTACEDYLSIAAIDAIIARLAEEGGEVGRDCAAHNGSLASETN